MTVYFVGWYGCRNSGDETFKLVHETMFPDHEETKFFVFGVGLDGQRDNDLAVHLRDRIIAGWFRNQQDVDYLVSQGVNAYYTPDVVFQLKNKFDFGRSIIEQKTKKKMVCFFSNNAVQHFLYESNLYGHASTLLLKRNIAESLDALADYYDYNFIPLSMDWNDYDLSFGMDVFTMMKRRECVDMIEKELSFQNIMDIVVGADMVLSMKFHGIIYSMVAERPFVNIGLSDKTQKICQESGLSGISVAPNTLKKDVVLSAVKKAEQLDTLEIIKKVSQRNYSLAIDAVVQIRDAINSHVKEIRML
jgi:polysaccharide pyruvyl transferase WcaK-like protein